MEKTKMENFISDDLDLCSFDDNNDNESDN